MAVQPHVVVEIHQVREKVAGKLKKRKKKIKKDAVDECMRPPRHDEITPRNESPLPLAAA